MGDYTPYYAGGWKPGNTGNTPSNKEALNNIEAGIAAAHTELDTQIKPGTIGFYPGTAAPPGWFHCNGASGLSTTTYAALFAVLQYTFGGSGAVFSLPDYRDYFLRGLDEGRGYDTGRAIATTQADALIDHEHTTTEQPINFVDGGNTYQWMAYIRQHSRSGVDTTNTGDAVETRPKNICMLVVMKY